MFQPDLFSRDLHRSDADMRQARAPAHGRPKTRSPDPGRPAANVADLDLPAVLERLAGVSRRPRYTFMVLNLIARAAGPGGSAGPFVREAGQAIPVRDWLSNALIPMAHRDARRRLAEQRVRADLAGQGCLPADPEGAERAIAEELHRRLQHSGRTNVSRAVSDLVRAGLLHRHYQGFRVDHENRGAQREAVYTLAASVRRALGKDVQVHRDGF